MDNNKEKYYKLFIFNNINDSRKFILDIIDILNYYDDDYDIDNKELIFNDNLCVCNIVDINKSKWKSECNIILDDYYKINIIYYRLIIYKFSDLIYYIEINGNNKLLNYIIKNINNYNYNYYSNFKIKRKNKINSVDKLYNYISNYLLNKNYYIYSYNKFCNKFRIPKINYINNDNNEFSYNNIINLYDDIINNKILDNNKKINELNLNNNNEYQYYNNTNKYNFLKLDFCDIYYDTENKLLFNYKTVKGYRILYLQIIYSLILLKTKPKNYLSINFINKFNIDIDNFKYVFGIIKNNDNDIDFKISIGTICFFLNKLNIEYYIDFI